VQFAVKLIAMLLVLINCLRLIYELLLLPVLLPVTLLARFSLKNTHIGLGPEPLINNIYHKKALQKYGYTAQTFVNDVYYITHEFDVRADRWIKNENLRRLVLPVFLFVYSIFKYQCLYIYFNGGALGLGSLFLWRVEPFLYKISNTKIVVMPYGSDVQDTTRSNNLMFKDALNHDYPHQRLRRPRISGQIDLWTKWADHVISGCEWVDYMYYWDTLMIAHFSIEIEPEPPPAISYSGQNKKTLRILHAPNHQAIKGTRYIVKAVNELREEGFDIELLTLQRVPNSQIRDLIASVDIVVDQLVVGWYAMFAIEAMAAGKSVLCYLREDLKQLYLFAGLLEPDEIPIINCSFATVKEQIRELALHPERLVEIGQKSRNYVIKHHSVTAVGKVFDQINRSINLFPQLSA
jgi:glycosyltransferase involved in cell wall biosynthesis